MLKGIIKITSRRSTVIAGIMLTLCTVWLSQSGLSNIEILIKRIEYVAYDLRMKYTLPNIPAVDDRIVIVAIDEKSLNKQGRWPWSRQTMAELTQKIFEYNAVVIGYDFLFAEPQLNSARQVLNEINKNNMASDVVIDEITRLSRELDYDKTFSIALRQGDTVLGYAFHNDINVYSGTLPQPLKKNTLASVITAMPSYTANIDVLQSAALSGGFLTTVPDDDGVLRRTPMLIKYNNHIYPSLSLEMMRLFQLIDEVDIRYADIAGQKTIESIQLGAVNIPTDAVGQVLIPFRGRSPAFKYISATDLLEGNAKLSDFENKMVLIGATALALSDLKATPVQNVYPGVEVHASVLSAMFDKRFPVEPSWAVGANVSILLGIGLIVSLFFPWLGPMWQGALSILMIIGITLINTWLWNKYGIALNLAMPIILLIVLSGLNMLLGFLSASNQRGQLKDMFSQYVPPALVSQMISHPEEITMEGVSRELTVLFADIRGFTSLSEKLSPNKLKYLLNSFFTPMTKVIFETNGTIDKYVGDMIMAFWGAPLPNNKHAVHAVDASLKMLVEVEKLKPIFAEQGLPEVNIGIGLNTGIMNVGDMGSHYRRAYTVLGDAVNLGARIEGLTKFYGVNLVIGEQTYAQVSDFYCCRKLDRVRVKGKQQGITVYQPLCRIEEAGKTLINIVERHHNALELFWDQQWDKANKLFQQLEEADSDTKIYGLYLRRIKKLKSANLSRTWDGVYDRTAK